MKNQPVRLSARPYIVCLCGSTRFPDAFRKANLDETLAGKIVLSVGGFCHTDKPAGEVITKQQKIKLDLLHMQKIDLADEVYILNVGGYIGESTARELAYAIFCKKEIRFLENTVGQQYLVRERHLLGKHCANFMMDVQLDRDDNIEIGRG
jgi:hypothetical protein